ncbi:MAG: MoaD/ThiS family protein [Gammaproteobacteria bacterium]
MPVHVLFFASLKDATGTAEVDLDLDAELPLDRFLSRVGERLGAAAFAAITAENVRIAVNQALVDGAVTIRPGDEVAFMPPVTGG